MKTMNKLLAMLLAVSILLGTALTATAAEDEKIAQSDGSALSDLMESASVNPLTGNESLPFILCRRRASLCSIPPTKREQPKRTIS